MRRDQSLTTDGQRRTDLISAIGTRLNRFLDRAYDACLALADGLLAHRSAVLALLAAVALVAIAINRLVLHDFPNSGDEYVYLYQAATLASGRLTNAAPPEAEAFAFNYIVQDGARLYGTFPIGWPLVLAIAMRAGIPVWLVNPLIGVLSLVLVARLGTRLYNARVGVLAATIVGVSSFFLFNAASYFSHTFCATLLLGAACLAARDDRSPAWVPIGVGFLVGWAVLARYLTGVVVGIPIVLLLLRGGVPAGRTLVLCCVGGLPWVVVLALYNHALTGSPWQLTTTPLTRSLWFRPGFVLRGADIWSTQLLRFAQWTPPLVLLIYLVYLRTAPRETRRGAIDWLLLLMAGTLYFYVERGGNQYGPRFYYEVFLFFVIFASAHLFREARFRDKARIDRVMFGMMAASLAAAPVALVAHGAIEERVVHERVDPFRTVREAGLENALVLIGGRVGTERSMAADDLTRNGTAFSGSVLYGLDISPEENCRVASAYPDRAPYVYVWDRARGRGTLESVVCPSQPNAPND